MSFLESFPFLGRRGKALTDGQELDAAGAPRSPRTACLSPPSLKVTLEKNVYRPGDMVVATIKIINESPEGRLGTVRDLTADAVLIESLSVDVRGIEKVDPQWLVTPKPPPGSKQRRGERTMLKSSSAVIVSNALIFQGSSNSYMVRTSLPELLPPTFRGTAVRYLYYISTALRWSRCASENGHGPSPPANSERLEVRTALPIWTLPHTNGLTSDVSHYGHSGIVPPYTLVLEIQWKEDNSESVWAWAADASLRNGEDRTSTPKSDGGSAFTSPTKSISLDRFDRSYSISSRATPLHLDPSFSAQSLSSRDSLSTSASVTDFSATPSISKQNGAFDSGSALKRACSLDCLSNEAFIASMNAHHLNGVASRHSNRVEEEVIPDSPNSSPAVYNRGKSYNIRMDGEVLVKFSPKNPTSTYYFGDMVTGTLQFFHNDKRRCLEVTAVLETREVLNPAVVHPSRKNSSTITKVHSEYYEIVNDVISTQFLFSIPLDGPASMATPLMSLDWILRFEFVATPLNVDWSKVEHPMLIDVSQRRKGEWNLPIIVHATPPKKPLPEAENSAKSWARSPSAIYKSLCEEYPERGSDTASPSGSIARD